MSVRSYAILAATAAIFAAAGAVHAAPASAQAAATSTKPMDFTVRADTTPLPGAQVMNWDAAKGHWGATLSVQQPEARAATANDIRAGAYYRITPSLRVGGSLAFGDQQVVPGAKANPADAGQPRVQLETKFKF